MSEVIEFLESMFSEICIHDVTDLLRDPNDSLTVSTILEWRFSSRTMDELKTLFVSVVVLDIESAKCTKTRTSIFTLHP
ncbi:hypothetical protein SAMN04488556_1869 [Halostagnicola kamekurae]|uniref:Uncharacterized protein n=1 Tax=Halostagnicola kamekurae TaxID=619731 RepID=A0A1I6RL79_9EURY|nr:hypothetical protein SAMN04488556_1869 [Halostagnicola kamekurae]